MADFNIKINGSNQWPLHQQLNEETLLAQLKPELVNHLGQKVNGVVTANFKQVNDEHTGNYPIDLLGSYKGNVVSKRLTLEVVGNLQATKETTKVPKKQEKAQTTTLNHKPHRMRKVLLTLLLVFLICLGWGMLHHQREQQNANQAKIGRLAKQNNALQRQLAALKAAQKQYQSDHNQEELNNSLNKIRQENAALRQKQQDNQQLSNILGEVDRYIDQIQNNPNSNLSELEQRVQQLANNQNSQGNFLQQLLNDWNQFFK